jgi:putative tryptophan/tyrosine transport system substrate-binding protein
MKRREFIAGLGAAAWPLAARAQQQTKPTIAWLDVQPGGPLPEYVEGFRRGLAEVGLSVGRDVTIENYLADGHPERLSALASDLVRRRPAAIVALQGFAASVAKEATRDIPIIFMNATDPVEFGLVASLNRPGGKSHGRHHSLVARSLKSALSCYTKRCRPLKQLLCCWSIPVR